jgi:hypothetical protein
MGKQNVVGEEQALRGGHQPEIAIQLGVFTLVRLGRTVRRA